METDGREPLDGHALKRLLRRRPEEGWRLVIRDLFPRVLGWLERGFGQHCRELIEDAMQEAVRRAMARLERFEPEVGTFDAWFASIARNETLRLLRDERLQMHEALPRELPTTPANSDPEPSSERVRVLLECLAALSPLQQKVLRSDLRGGELKATELARELGSSASSVYVARHHGLRILREELRKRGHG